MTALAETTIDFALDEARCLARRESTARRSRATGARQRLIVVGMGKLGGGELNVSSDIDLIFVYPEDGRDRGPRPLSRHEYFTRLGRKLINALAEITADGFVFRVDMRLRPYGDSGPLVVSFDMLEDYLSRPGARVGTLRLGQGARARRRARRGADGDRHALRLSPAPRLQRLRSPARAARADPSTEVEAPRASTTTSSSVPAASARSSSSRRCSSSCAAAATPPCACARRWRRSRALPQRGWLPAGVLRELRGAYVFLRNLEHRLQYLDDQQTQTLPDSPRGPALIAQAMGFADYARLAEQLERHRGNVHAPFRRRVRREPHGGRRRCRSKACGAAPVDDPAALAQLAALGYAESCAALERIARAARQRAASGACPPRRRRAWTAWCRGCSRPQRTSRPPTRRSSGCSRAREHRPARILSRAADRVSAGARAARAAGTRQPVGGDYLARHPMLLDELIDPQQLADARLGRPGRAPRRGAGRRRGRHRAADGHAAPLQAGADPAPARAGPGRHAAAGNADAIT